MQEGSIPVGGGYVAKQSPRGCQCSVLGAGSPAQAPQLAQSSLPWWPCGDCLAAEMESRVGGLGLQRGGYGSPSPPTQQGLPGLPSSSSAQGKQGPGRAGVCRTWPGSPCSHGTDQDKPLRLSCLLLLPFLRAAALPQFTLGMPQSQDPPLRGLGDRAGGPLLTQHGLGNYRKREYSCSFPRGRQAGGRVPPREAAARERPPLSGPQWLPTVGTLGPALGLWCCPLSPPPDVWSGSPSTWDACFPLSQAGRQPVCE